MSFKAANKSNSKWKDRPPKLQQPDEYQSAVYNDGSVPKHSIDSLIDYWYARRDWDEKQRNILKSWIDGMYRVRFYYVTGVNEAYFEYLVSPGLNIAIGPVNWYSTGALSNPSRLFTRHSIHDIDITASTRGQGANWFNKNVDEELEIRLPNIQIMHAGAYGNIALTGIEEERQRKGYTWEFTIGGLKQYDLWTLTGVNEIVKVMIRDLNAYPNKNTYLPEKPEPYSESGFQYKPGYKFVNVDAMLVSIPQGCIVSIFNTDFKQQLGIMDKSVLLLVTFPIATNMPDRPSARYIAYPTMGMTEYTETPPFNKDYWACRKIVNTLIPQGTVQENYGRIWTGPEQFAGIWPNLEQRSNLRWGDLPTYMPTVEELTTAFGTWRTTQMNKIYEGQRYLEAFMRFSSMTSGVFM